jgi:hypothetical protein
VVFASAEGDARSASVLESRNVVADSLDGVGRRLRDRSMESL